jgi:photosystem II stability/assembly factor-like uncharacterized protein
MYMLFRPVIAGLILSCNVAMGQWSQLSPAFTTEQLNTIRFTGSKGCISSTNGIYLSEDRGQTWRNVKAHRDYEMFFGAAMADRNHFTVLGFTSELNKTSFGYFSGDAGTSWSNPDFGIPYALTNVTLRGKTGWITGYYLYPPPYPYPLLRTTDGGDTWTQLSGFSHVFFHDTKLGWASDGGRIYRTTDAGSSWTVQYSPESGSALYGLTFVDASTGWAYGSMGYLLKTIDGGNHWSVNFTGDYGSYECACFLDINNGWIAGHKSIIRTTNGGVNWSVSELGTYYDYSVTSILFLNRDKGFLCTYSNEVFKSTNGGATWEKLSGVQGRSVWFADSLLGYTAGNASLIFKTTDGGSTWTQQLVQTGSTVDLAGIAFIDASAGLAVGSRGTILRTTNGGNDWEIRQSYSLPMLKSIAAVAPDNVWFCGQYGLIMKYSDGGKAIQHQLSRVSELLSDICFVDKDHGWAMSNESDLVLRTTNGGADWIGTHSGDSGTPTSISFIDTSTGWLLTNSYTVVLHQTFESVSINKTMDGGRTWQHAVRVDSSFSRIFFINRTDGFMVGDHGRIRKTTDGGNSWTREPSGTSADLKDISICRYMYIVGSNGTVLRSDRMYSNTDPNVVVPVRAGLSQNYPNPFNPTTVIRYDLPFAGILKLAIYDLLGREVRVVVDEFREAGTEEVKFDGSGLPAGVYFCRMETAGFTQTRKLLLLR